MRLLQGMTTTGVVGLEVRVMPTHVAPTGQGPEVGAHGGRETALSLD